MKKLQVLDQQVGVVLIKMNRVHLHYRYRSFQE
jgi:hypothetical protein